MPLPQVIKLYAWELPFKKLISLIRNKELVVLRKIAYYSAFMIFSWTCAPFLVSRGSWLLVGGGREGQKMSGSKVRVQGSL